MIRIQITIGVRSNEVVVDADRITVGRSDRCDVVLADLGFLSREHLEIEIDGSSCRVRDLNSRHGVALNGEAVDDAPLNAGDEITVGRLSLELIAFKGAAHDRREKICISCGHPIGESGSCCSDASITAKRPAPVQFSSDHFPGYSLIRELGRGGMGIVFEAKRDADGGTCAIKVIHPHLASQDAYLVRFVEETRALTMLDHPNIVRIHESGAAQGLAYIDMEFVPGESAQAMVARAGSLGEATGLKVAWQMALALDYAADRKVIHGDVKPANFIIEPTGRSKLCDFGLANHFSWSATKQLVGPGLTGRKGTPAYAAPERFQLESKSTVQSDIYSLGVSLYQMLTGRLPFGGNSAAARNRKRQPTPEGVCAINASLRPSTAFLIQGMMESDSAHRYFTWRSVQDDLSLLL